jgi:hypothetical protein
MPYTVTDLDGQQHTFPDGTPTATIQAEMQQRMAAKRQQSQPQPNPTLQPGKQPYGMVSGPANSRPSSLLEQPMPDLDEEGQRAMNMIAAGGVEGDKNLEQAGRMLADKNPSYQIRKSMSDSMGKQAATRNEMRGAGENILGAYSQLLHAWENTPEDERVAATGPTNMAEVPERSPYTVFGFPIPATGDRPTTIDPVSGAPIAGKLTTVQRNAILNPNDEAAQAAAGVQTEYGHLQKGITNSLLAAATKGMTMSDKRQEAFDSAMRDFSQAPSREMQRKILEHAKTIIQTDFNLTPQEADHVVATNLRRLQLNAHQQAVERSEQIPHPAILELIANPTPKAIRSFNKHFNNGERGLAEYVMQTSAASPEVDSPALQQPAAPAQQYGRRARPASSITGTP